MNNEKLKNIINLEIANCHILDAVYDENQKTTQLKVIFFRNEMDFNINSDGLRKSKTTKTYEIAPDGEPIVHTLTYRNEFGTDYLLDGRQDESAYERFKQLLFTRSSHLDFNYEPQNAVFNSIARYLENDTHRNAVVYGEAVKSASKTKVWLEILKQLEENFSQKDLEIAISEKLDSLMARYLNEHPEFLERLAIIANSAENILNSHSSISLKPSDKTTTSQQMGE